MYCGFIIKYEVMTLPKSENQKLKILYVLDILTRFTDEEHGISMSEIISRLGMLGIVAERKSVYNDIFLLREYYGADIEMRRTSGTTEYFLLSRVFELPELKLLVDAVGASRFITQKKSIRLINKLKSLAGGHADSLLHGQVVVTDRIKTMNESVYYNVDTVNEAINRDRMLSFRYFEWLPSGEKRLRRGGEYYKVSPCALCWDNENYYLIAVEQQTLKHYRVDKMVSISCLEEKRVRSEAFENFNAADYTSGVFGMYGGDKQTVTLHCSNSIAGAVIDRFGSGIMLRQDNDGFNVTLDLCVSPQFFAWLAGFGSDIQVTHPPKVRERYKNYISDILALY